MLVATKTQKDPKEFLPYLESLKAMDPTYRKYRIHFDLKNFERALEILSAAPDEDGKLFSSEVLPLVRK